MAKIRRKFVIPQTITEEELKELVKKTENPRYKRIYTLLFYQCLRISELIKLRKEDYFPNTKLLHIREAKGKKDRKIPINPLCVPIIKHLPFTSKKSRDGGVRAVQIALKKGAKSILNKDIHPHTLRHSGATYYLNKKKWDIRQLQRFLGHSDIKTTQGYLHVNPEDLTALMWEI